MRSDRYCDDSVPYFRIGFAAGLFVIGATWLVQGNDFFLARVFAPRMEAVRRETFEESKAYNEGVAQELRRMKSEYVRATPEQKEALGSLILHQTASYDERRLPVDLQDFLSQLRQN